MMNLFSDEVRRNPYPVYEQLRSRSPVLHEPHSDLWMVFDYEGVKRALHDHEAFSPLRVIAELLGAPTVDPPRFKHWSDVIMGPRLRRRGQRGDGPGAA